MSDGFDFTPLSYEEREVAADALAPDDKPNDAVPSLPPADAEPGSRAAARLFGRAPDSYWRYATAEGETAFYICRWNAASGEKEIRPLSWIEGEGWRFKQGLDARRLYNLDLISANEKTHIVVCEGEKAADAAATVFFESIATTSSGGSNAVKKSDWTPLAGRKVLIWPDNDKAGVKYAREVGAILAALGCEVSTIDASALAAIDPVGGSREAMEKWDAANAIGEWRDLGALRKAALGSAKAIAREPEYVSFGIYEMGADGLFAEIEKGRGEARVKEAVWIAAPFEILGACRDPQGGGWGKWLRWRDGDSRIHRRHVSDAALQGEPAPMCAELASQGLRILRGQQRHLANYLSGARVSGRVTMVDRTGWHEISGQWVFVLPEETIGPRGAETVILDAAARGGYEARGTL
jgi:putative DNA primase/helicase